MKLFSEEGMTPLRYLKSKGIKKAIKVLYQSKIDLLICFLINYFTASKDLNNIIIFESQNDFDCNSGAFYDYLISQNLNSKYKFVWILKNNNTRICKLPANVECFFQNKPSIKKDYYLCIAKYFIYDYYLPNKIRKDQIAFYLTHGAGGLKKIKGFLNMKGVVDYVLLQSESYAPIQVEQYGLSYPGDNLLYLGYPVHDRLNSNNTEEIKKVTKNKYNKTIMWMPTYRKGDWGRNDSNIEAPLGVPLLRNEEEYQKLNLVLHQENILLIIKIHPHQDMTNFRLMNLSNIEVLTPVRVKELGIDNYSLIGASDALISDYSGAAYEYLQLNRPIAYVLNDKDDYKLGFVVEDIHKLMAGKEIYTLEDMLLFIKEVSEGNDNYKEKREKLRDYIYKFHDTHNCERLAEFMGL